MFARSMTGFGSAQFSAGTESYRVEIRSVNHKGLDLKLRIPREFLPLEQEIAALVRERVVRGHLEVFITSEGVGSPNTKVVVNRSLAQAVASAFSALGGELGLTGGVPLQLVVQQEGVVQVVDSIGDPATWKSELFEGLSSAIERLDDARRSEGVRLAVDLEERAQQLSSLIARIEAESSSVRADVRARLRRRWEELARGEGFEWNEQRVEQELVLLADRSDITEELVRLASHVDEIRALLRSPEDEPLGKRLGFLVQELHREASTIASKTGKLAVTRLCIDVRCEIERIREQAMNLE
jgi:uncharacterized protein (TIGR00255 family)